MNNTSNESNTFSNSGSLPPLPPLPSDSTSPSVVATDTTTNVVQQLPVSQPQVVTPNQTIEPQISEASQVNPAMPTQQAPIQNIQPVEVVGQTQVTESSEPPVVHLIPAPSEVKPEPSKLSETPSMPTVQKAKGDKFNILIALLGFVLFIMLAVVGYLVIQLFA